MATIYRKTAKGQQEIETRAHRLVPRLRSALILVDGRRSDDELLRMILQQPQDTLRELSEQGFIEIIGITQGFAPARAPVASPAPAPAAAAPAAAAAPRPVLADFGRIRSGAVRSFTDLVGPMAEALAIKMERARDAVELRPLAQMAQKVVANARGSQAAAEFGSKYVAPLGG